MARYRRRRNNGNDIDGGLMGVAFVVFFITYKLKEFYDQSPILFISISVTVISLVIYIFMYFRKKKRNRLVAIETIEDMQKLHWREFEKFIEFVFKEKGFKAKTRKGTKDGGIDVDASLEGRKYLIQCKKWNKYKISEPNMREFYGSVMAHDQDAKGIYVTTTNLTYDAKLFAEKNDIEIWDKNTLESHVKDYLGKENLDTSNIQNTPQNIPSEGSDDPTCSKCGSSMIKRQAHQGNHKGEFFYGCSSFPKCRNIENIKKT